MSGRDIVGLIELAATSTALGYVSILSKDLLKGLQPPIPTSDNWWKVMFASMAQGGGLGILGDFLFSQYDRFGHSFIETVAGPSLGTLDDAVRLFTQLTHLDNPNRTALTLAENNLPFINLWFLRTALNYTFLWALQEKISPGSTRRMVNNVEKEQNTKFLISPYNALGVR
jgi:hypothetical protein